MKLFRKLVVLVIIILGIFFLKGNITGMSILDVKNIDMPDINLGEMGLDDIGIGNNDKKVEIKTVNENINTPDIYFCPKHNCSAVMVDLIKDAKKSVHCALFDLDLIELILLICLNSAPIFIVSLKKYSSNLSLITITQEPFS